jgi:hypothetical protein
MLHVAYSDNSENIKMLQVTSTGKDNSKITLEMLKATIENLENKTKHPKPSVTLVEKTKKTKQFVH